MDVSYKSLLKNVRCFVFDVDGVMTDGSLVVMPGELYRIMNIRDGYAISEAVKYGYQLFVISGGSSESVRQRLERLGVKEIHLGVSNKSEVLLSLLSNHGIRHEEVLYMGDDLPDFEVIQHAGVRACPKDAVPEIKALCQYISMYDGGKGCVRDIIEQVMRVQSNWPYQNPTAE